MSTTQRLTRELKVLSSVLANRLTANPWQEKMDRALVEMVSGVLPSDPATESPAGEPQLSNVAETLAERVRNEGVILFPAAITGLLLDALRDEFQQMIETSDSSPYIVDRHDGAICVRIDPRPSLDKKAYPATNAFFDSYVFRAIARSFYQSESQGFNFNNTIFVHETPETTSPLSGKLHWDRTQALKFWIYIDDIPMEAGPMRIHPGSTPANKVERIDKRRQAEHLEGGKDNVVDAAPEEIRYLAGPAGTVLIHDSDCSHGASPVTSGQFRRIMRGHCRAAQPTRSTALQRLVLNPQRFYRC